VWCGVAVAVPIEKGGFIYPSACSAAVKGGQSVLGKKERKLLTASSRSPFPRLEHRDNEDQPAVQQLTAPAEV
jgi:hypothetical protein